MALLLALWAAGPAQAVPEVGALELSLSEIDQRIAEDDQAFKAALSAHDVAEVGVVGSRLRELKRRRARMVRDLAEAQRQRQRRDAGETKRERPELRRRLQVIEPQVQEAAAAFAADPSERQAIRLRRLSAEAAELKEAIRAAEEAPGTAGDTPTGRATAFGGRP